MKQLVERQRRLFLRHKTQDIDYRKAMLKNLYDAIESYEDALYDAFWIDLHKSKQEVYTTEIGIVKRSIKSMIRNVRRYSRARFVWTPLLFFGRTSKIYHDPYGTVLIIGPYNYPFQLVIEPLIGAIAAGNTAIIKPSELTPHVSAVIQEMIRSVFPQDYIEVVIGGKEVVESLIDAEVDFIFYTGSQRVGSIIMQQAAKHLIPVVLELGGKSPVIIEKDAKLDVVIERLVWGKFLNAGQTCVAPDYVLVDQDIVDIVIEKTINAIQRFYGSNAETSDDYPRMCTRDHAMRMERFMESNRDAIVYGGEVSERYVSPTIFKLNSIDSSLMESEIFGPLLPILTYRSDVELDKLLQHNPHPLAFYVFTENKRRALDLITNYTFGGGMINDVILHVANPYLPFGGIGPSGMGAYHGKESYDVFTHRKSVMDSSTIIRHKLLFPPYTKKRLRMFKRFYK